MPQNIITNLQIKSLKENFQNEFVFLSILEQNGLNVVMYISGARLYGFESFNSDLDIRGVHLPKLSEILRYFNTPDTLEKSFIDSKIWSEEIDLVSARGSATDDRPRVRRR